MDSTNIAEDLDKHTLDMIGSEAKSGYEDDLDSRSEWEERNDQWMKLASQVIEGKSFPWEGASNVKYPLLTTAAIQFHARAYPALVPNTDIVKVRVTGKDLDGQKHEKAVRIGKHMTYQLLEQMPEWEEDMDKLCLSLPIVGCAFKKTYYSPLHERNVSELVPAKALVVNYWAKSLEEAYRKTQIIEMNENQLIERQRAGVYIDCDLGDPQEGHTGHRDVSDEIQGLSDSGSIDASTPYIICEQHSYLDLDEDGYKEPYIITFEAASGKVLRIVANYSEEDIVTNDKDEVVRITPFEHFTKFSFIPNPDGGFYDVGFGILLGPINESVNTLINQITDAGTMSNLQSGFLGRGIKLKRGDDRFKPGEWKTINSTGDDLRKSILPLPVREPSGVLFQLLSTLLESGQRLAQTTDMMVGENPGQNQAATTTMAVVEQGMKVFTAIYKRIHRSLKKEYKKLFKLNAEYLDVEEYFTILDPDQETQGMIGFDDYDLASMDVIPSADPNIITEAQKLAKAQGLLELLPLGINPEIVKRRVLEAQEQYNIDELLQPVEQGEDPELALKNKELDHRISYENRSLDIKERELGLRGAKEQHGALMKERDADREDYKATTEAQKKGSFEYNYGGNITK